MPISVEDRPWPTRQQVAAASRPRHYRTSGDAKLSLMVPKIGIYEAPVLDSFDWTALDRSVVYLPQTPMPWDDEREQKNVYLAGHRLGWPGSGSHMIFFNLDKLKKGDSVVLEGRERARPTSTR